MTIDTDKQNRTRTSQPLAAGTYLVGDPCYAFTNDGDAANQWHEWLEDAWKDVDANRLTILDGRVRGMRIAASCTQYGDGEYEGSNGASYPVDAGLLGAVHIGFLRNLYPEGLDIENSGLQVVEFPEPFHVEYDPETGTVYVGHVAIHTGDADEDEGCEHCGEADCSGECLEPEDDDDESGN